jgi:hypothetical protein
MHPGISMTDKQIEQKKQNGYERLGRTERQNQGYDEAAHGGKNVPPSDVGIPPNPEEGVGGDEFDRAARDAANDVRRRDKSAD